MMMRTRIIPRSTHGGEFSPIQLFGELLLHIAPLEPCFASARNAASIFAYLMGVRFLCGGGPLVFQLAVEAEEMHSRHTLKGWLFWSPMAHPVRGGEDFISSTR